MSKINCDRLAELINEHIEKNDISLRYFAGKCGLSHSYVDKLRKGSDPRTGKPVYPTIETLSSIAHAMGLSLKELLVKTEYLPDEEPKRYYLGQELEDIIPDEYKDLFDIENFGYIKFIKDMKKEDITPAMLTSVFEALKKIRKENNAE